MNNLILELDEFVRSVEISQNEVFSFFLGAGASITSGIPSASDCIWHWKKSIYSSRTGISTVDLNIKMEQARVQIQKWLDNEGVYPALGDIREYSIYIEKCYPIEDDRRKFFNAMCAGKNPSIGYKLLALLNELSMVHSVWTTNFDDLCIRAANNNGNTVIDISLETVERVNRPLSASELLLIKLHGDYKYGPLKNTTEELKEQDSVFRNYLINYLKDKHLIVSGFSGRDDSIMDALSESYSMLGGGRLYWCGYGREIPEKVFNLINVARANGRTAFYIPIDGFDKMMISLAKAFCKGSAETNIKFTEQLRGIDSMETNSPFSMQVTHTNAIIKSNLFEVKFPQEVFQFDYNFDYNDRRWQQIRDLISTANIVAVPFEKVVWALGNLSEINTVFADKIIGKITRVPISDKIPHDESALYHLLLSSLTRSLANIEGLETNGKNLIWETDISTQKKVGNLIYFTHKAIRLSLSFDGRRHLLSLMPDFNVTSEIQSSIKIGRDVYQDIGRQYFDKMRNKEFNDYVNSWRTRLFDSRESSFEIDFPSNSGSGFLFTIRRTPAFANIMLANSNSGKVIHESFPKGLLYYQGIQYTEPQLLFSPKHNGMTQVPKDFHPMRGLLNNKPYDYQNGGVNSEEEIRLGVICPKPEASIFSPFLKKIQVKVSTNGINSDYLIDYPGFYDIYNISLNVPEMGTDNWLECDEVHPSNSLQAMALSLRNLIVRKIDLLVSDNIKKVIIICIPSRWTHLCSYDLENESFDLHDYIKAYCAEKSIATQFIQEDTLHDGLKCQINWWLSLSYYVKSLRTPWALDSLDKETAFAGIGYSVTKKNDKTDIVVGCSHIYNSLGQGLKYRLSKVEDKLVWDRLDKPHLSYQDSYNFGISIVDLFYQTMSNFPKRIVIHKRNYFTKDEINGLRDSLLNTDIKSLDLIEINYEEDIRFVAGTLSFDGKPDITGFPINRGTCIVLSAREALLWTHGVVTSVRNENFKYYLGGRFIPGPLKIVKHYGNGNIGTIANEILALTKVNWNSFDLYSQLPATVSSSNEIARIGRLLSRKEGATYDYRYFI